MSPTRELPGDRPLVAVVRGVRVHGLFREAPAGEVVGARHTG